MAACAEREYSTDVYKDYVAAAPLKRATFRRRIKCLKKLGAKGRLLDVGCGCGFFIQVALEHGFTVNIGEMLAFAQPQIDGYEDTLSAKSVRRIADVSRPSSSLAPHEDGGC
jgi:cyclopropane fatty-acyl-phospholipid synthase-like methyltransferase